MEFRDTRTRVLVGAEDYAHQLLGKDPRIFRQTQGQNWSYEQVMSLFRAMEEMPSRSARLHGVKLTALTQEQANRIAVGDLLLQIYGDRHNNKCLRKTVVEVVEIEAPANQSSDRATFRVQKVWPMSIDWAYIAWTNPEDICNPGNHLNIRPDLFPTLHFGFEVVQADCYNYIGSPKYEAAAKKAADFMAMLECHELAQRVRRGDPGGSFRIDRPGKINALTEDLGNAFWAMNQNFASVYYALRTLLVDKTMQGFGGLINDQRRIDRITPLMQAIYKDTIARISNESPASAKDSKIIQALVDPASTSSSVADRLRALLNPAYFPEPDRSEHWKVYNRWGVFCGLAGNLQQGSPEGGVLQRMFESNFSILKADMSGLTTNGLDFYWKK